MQKVSPAAIFANHSSPRLIDSLKEVYRRLDAETVTTDLLDSVYDESLMFEDPFHRIVGLKHFKRYCAGMYANTRFCHFDFSDEWVSAGNAMLTWKMTYAHSRLNKGEPITVHGATQIQFAEKIVYHRDYFDSAQLIFDHLPLVGRMLRMVKQRLVNS